MIFVLIFVTTKRGSVVIESVFVDQGRTRMATCECAALSISGLCLVYNVALTAFRASTFEVFNVTETVARSVSILFINLAAYSLSKTENPRAQVCTHFVLYFVFRYLITSFMMYAGAAMGLSGWCRLPIAPGQTQERCWKGPPTN